MGQILYVKMMIIEIVSTIPENSYRIVCKSCMKVYEEASGGITEGNIASMKYKDMCLECGKMVVLQVNPKEIQNKYSAANPYPENKC